MISMNAIIRFNRLLLICICFALIGFAGSIFLPWAIGLGYGNDGLKTDYAPLSGPALPPMAFIERNIFDLSGAPWQGRVKPGLSTASAPASADLSGLIDLPGLQGAFVGNKFIPLGGDSNIGQIQGVENGRVKINSSQGPKEIDINLDRVQKRQSLNINIQ